MIPRFQFTRLPLGDIKIRPAAFSVASVLTVAVYLLLRRRRTRGMPPYHPDRLVRLSDEEQAAWARFEDDALEDVGLAILDDKEMP